MTAPGNDVLLTVLLVAFTASTGYAAGRIHQWYRTALERDQAYRDGYDMATRSLFSLAARFVRTRRGDKPAVRGTATVTSILAAPSHGVADDGPGASGRHTVPDELVSGPTYRLTPDRVARAKVQPEPDPAPDDRTTALDDRTTALDDRTTAKVRIVPKPRAS